MFFIFSEKINIPQSVFYKGIEKEISKICHLRKKKQQLLKLKSKVFQNIE